MHWREQKAGKKNRQIKMGERKKDREGCKNNIVVRGINKWEVNEAGSYEIY